MRAETTSSDVPPVLVLGLGNRLLTDDGVGLELLQRVAARTGDDPRVELIDGGTQGIALLGRLAGRRALLVLDAVAHGSGPGVVHHLRGADSVAGRRAASAHEGNAAELLAAARLVGDLPAVVEVVGIEPAEVRTGIGLSGAVRTALEEATQRALETLRSMLRSALTTEAECTS